MLHDSLVGCALACVSSLCVFWRLFSDRLLLCRCEYLVCFRQTKGDVPSWWPCQCSVGLVRIARVVSVVSGVVCPPCLVLPCRASVLFFGFHDDIAHHHYHHHHEQQQQQPRAGNVSTRRATWICSRSTSPRHASARYYKEEENRLLPHEAL